MTKSKKSRVNITIKSKQNNSNQSVELPFKLLILAPINPNKKNSKQPLAVRLNQPELDNAFSAFNPQLNLQSPLKNNYKITPKKASDLRPDALLENCDHLSHIIKIKTLLLECKSMLCSNTPIKDQIEKKLAEDSYTLDRSEP